MSLHTGLFLCPLHNAGGVPFRLTPASVLSKRGERYRLFSCLAFPKKLVINKKIKYMGHYDLYGNSYSSRTEALNAEMTQCNEIDNRLLRQEIDKLKYQQPQQQEPDFEIYHMQQHINSLEERIQKLERLLNSS